MATKRQQQLHKTKPKQIRMPPPRKARPRVGRSKEGIWERWKLRIPGWWRSWNEPGAGGAKWSPRPQPGRHPMGVLLERAIMGVRASKPPWGWAMTESQWTGMVLNASVEAGYQRAEVEWLDQWLDAEPGDPHKAQGGSVLLTVGWEVTEGLTRKSETG